MIDGAEPLTELSTADLVVILGRTAEAMRAHAPGLDAIDVVPAPDGDTGANLAVTAVSLAASAAGATSIAALAGSLVTAAPSAARGLSGRLFAEFTAGWADAVRNSDRIDAERFALGLEAGAERARAAVPRPIEGTMLSVIDAAVAAALGVLDAGGLLSEVVVAANDGGLDALERTAEQLPALLAAGVVDAGAAGWLVWLDAVVAHVLGDDGVADEVPEQPVGDDGEARWDIRFRIRCDAAAAETLGGVLASLGDVTSLERTDPSDGLWSVAVAADDIGAVIEAALSVGRPVEIAVNDAPTVGGRG